MNNIVLLEACIDEFKTENGLDTYKDDELFELFCGIELTKESETDFSEIEDAIVDGGNDGGIDTFIILINDKSVSSVEELNEVKINEKTRVKVALIQSKTEKSFREVSLDKLFITLPIVLDLTISEDDLLIRFNERLVEKVLLFREVWITAIKKKANIDFDLIYACKADSVIINETFNKKKKQIMELIKKNLPTAKINFKLISSEELVSIYNYRVPVELELRFKEGPVAISFSENEYGYIGTVSINDYYNFIVNHNNEIREEVFENNIRHFQGDVDVNKKIVKTLKSDNVRDFWWLNNGITIITSSCRPIPNILYITDAQVVNGLQTSFSVFNTFSEIVEKEKRSILVKIIVSNDKETIDKVIEATNSQNAVPPVLLRATDDIQRMIEKYFISKSFYYDRRKNYYRNQGKPITKIFTIQDVAQSMEALLYKNPSTARKNPTTIIKSNESYARIFNNDIDYSVYLKCARIVRSVKVYLNSLDDSSNKNFLKNFSFHISLLVLISILNKTQVNVEDIQEIKLEGLDNNFIHKQIRKFDAILQKYMRGNDENPINIAKSINFDKYIITSLKE